MLVNGAQAISWHAIGQIYLNHSVASIRRVKMDNVVAACTAKFENL